MIKPRRVGHATFETADIEKQIAYWTEVAWDWCWPSARRTAPSWRPRSACCRSSSNKADRAHCTRLSFEVAPNSDFGELAKELAKDGINSELRNDSIPGMGKVLTFKDNKDTTIDLFKEWKLSRQAPPGRAASGRSSSGTSRSTART